MRKKTLWKKVDSFKVSPLHVNVPTHIIHNLVLTKKQIQEHKCTHTDTVVICSEHADVEAVRSLAVAKIRKLDPRT